MGPSLFDCRWPLVSLIAMLLGTNFALGQGGIDHLLEAASHLEQAGFPEKAAEIREISRQREWQETLGYVRQLQRAEHTRGPRIGLRLKVLEFSAKKVRETGLPLVSIQQLLDNDAPVTLVDETGSLGKFIEFLHKQALMELVCEPALATVPGTSVSICLDGGDVSEPDEFGVAHKEAPGSCKHAIRFDCTPQVAEGGRLDLQIRFRQTEGTSAGSCDSAGRDATGSGALLEIETRVEIEPGQQVILCGRRCRDKLDEDIGVLVLIAAELAASPHAVTAAQ